MVIFNDLRITEDKKKLIVDCQIFFLTIKKVLFREDINQEGSATSENFNGHN